MYSNNNQTVNPHYLILNNAPQDANEIDLLHLFTEIYKRKTFIIGLSSLCCIIAVAIALCLPPTYQIKARLFKPTADTFQSFSVNSGLNITSDDLFDHFIKTLSQKGNVIEYLKTRPLELAEGNQNSTLQDKSTLQKLNAEAKNYVVTVTTHTKTDLKDYFRDDSKDVELLTLSPTLDLKAKNNLNYIDYTNKKVLENLVTAQKTIVQNKISLLENSIARKIATVSASRLNEIKRLTNERDLAVNTIKGQIEALSATDLRTRQLRLEELQRALTIAKSLGITQYNQPREIKSQGVLVDINQNTNELYLKGTDYLEKEIALTKSEPHTPEYQRKVSELQHKLYLLQHDKKVLALTNRTDDIPYVENYEKSIAKLNRLKALTYDISDVKSYKLDGPPQIETSPIKPNKALIVLLGCIMGLMLSTFIVLIQISIASRKLT